MGTEKGFLKDEDKFSKSHQEITDWFTTNKNSFDFLWEVFRLPVSDADIEIEVPVYSPNRFLFGYADAIITGKLADNCQVKILCEFKSTIHDYAAVLRQIKTYLTNISNVNYTVLITNDKRNWATDDNGTYSEEFMKLGRTLFTQKVFLYDLISIDSSIGPIDHYFSLKEEEYIDERGRVKCGGSPFIGFWDVKMIAAMDKSFIVKNSLTRNVVIEYNLVDPKYHVPSVIYENAILREEDFQNILNTYGITIEKDTSLSIEPALKSNVQMMIGEYFLEPMSIELIDKNKKAYQTFIP